MNQETGVPVEDAGNPITTKAQQKQTRREERKKQQEMELAARLRQKQIKKAALWSLPVIGIAFVGWIITQTVLQPPDPNIIAPKGLHWHADLAITIKGQSIPIPSGIGMGAVHADMHTHKVNDQVHVEMQRPTRRDDVKLGRFFQIWGKTFTSSCILNSCNGSEGTVTLLMNGKPNTEFENYQIQDKDRIEIRYE
jgi:hypothetical protein